MKRLPGFSKKKNIGDAWPEFFSDVSCHEEETDMKINESRRLQGNQTLIPSSGGTGFDLIVQKPHEEATW